MDKTKLFSNFQDRRKHDRLLRNFQMRYSFLEDLSRHRAEKEAELLDIGGGGIRFLTDERLSDGSQLMIELEIPGWQVKDGDWVPSNSREDIGQLQVIGVVMWVAASKSRAGRYEVGLRFTGQVR